jgi:hypothetical protein
MKALWYLAIILVAAGALPALVGANNAERVVQRLELR